MMLIQSTYDKKWVSEFEITKNCKMQALHSVLVNLDAVLQFF